MLHEVFQRLIVLTKLAADLGNGLARPVQFGGTVLQGGFHVGTQTLVAGMDPADPLLGLLANLAGVAGGVVHDLGSPLMGLQLHAGQLVLHRVVGFCPRLQQRDLAAQGLNLPLGGGQVRTFLLQLPGGLFHLGCPGRQVAHLSLGGGGAGLGLPGLTAGLLQLLLQLSHPLGMGTGGGLDVI